MLRLSLAVLGASLAAAPADARPGDLDRSFSRDGRLTLVRTAALRGVALLDARGRPVVSIQDVRSGPRALRLTTSGRVEDRTPLPGSEAPELADGYTLAPAGRGQLVLARIGGGPVALSPPSGFEMYAFGVDGAGRAVVLGAAHGVRTVLRFLPDGRLDTSYGNGGAGEVDVAADPYQLIVRRDGSAVFLGTSSVTALGADGRQLPDYEQNAEIPWPEGPDPGVVDAFARGPGATLLVAARDAGDLPFVARLRADGRLDRRFGAGGIVRLHSFLDFTAGALTHDARGRVVLAGSTWHRGDRYTATVIRLSARHRLDRTFGTRGAVTLAPASVSGVKLVSWPLSYVAIDDHGRILVGGGALDGEKVDEEGLGNPRPALARLKG